MRDHSFVSDHKRINEVTALITIDLQYDFFDRPGNPNAGRLEKAVCLPAVRRLLQHARSNGWKIIHVATRHGGKDTLPPHLLRRDALPYCLANSVGSNIVSGITQDGEVIIDKQSYDAFSNPMVVQELEGHEVVIICGVAANCCVLFSAHSAANVYRKRVYLPYQAIAASKIEDYVHGLRIAEKSIAEVVDLQDVLAASGSNPTIQKLEPLDEILFEEKIRNWFTEQLQYVSRLREQSLELPVEEILQRLEAMSAS